MNSVMIEIYYHKPADTQREAAIEDCLANHQGKVTYREEDSCDTICLTAEFTSREEALVALKELQQPGQHVEGPSDY